MKKGKPLIIFLVLLVVAAFGAKASMDYSFATRNLYSFGVVAKADEKASEPTATPKKTAAPKATPSPTAPPSPTMGMTAVPELISGSKGDEVAALQELLIQYGYLSGPASGEYDNATVMAVMDFQINNGLKETGVCDKEVWEKITNQPRQQETVYKSKRGKVYHSWSGCSGMKTATEMTLSDALRKGLTPCLHCH